MTKLYRVQKSHPITYLCAASPEFPEKNRVNLDPFGSFFFVKNSICFLGCNLWCLFDNFLLLGKLKGLQKLLIS